MASTTDHDLSDETVEELLSIIREDDETALKIFLGVHRIDQLRLHSDGTNAVNPMAPTPLMHAVHSQSPQVLRVLLTVNDPLFTLHNGCNALMEAVRWGQLDCAQILLEVQPEAACAQRSSNGMTALMIAACMGQPDCLRALLPYSDCTARDDQGRDAFDWSIQGNLKEQMDDSTMWACTQILSAHVERSRIVERVPSAPPGTFPQIESEIERDALAESLATPGDGSSGAPSSPLHDHVPPRRRTLRM